MSYHEPVMMTECLNGLNIKDDGIFVDLTFGGGGHSKEIMKRLKTGKVIGFDQDAQAASNVVGLDEPSFLFIEANYRHMQRYLKLHGYAYVDGILADLGMSSHQIDLAERGFSTRYDGPLDMRMDQRIDRTAARILNEYPARELQSVLSRYGEVRNAATLSRLIEETRSFEPFETCFQLKDLLRPLAPRGRENKYYAQVFQALRIEVNDEMNSLEEMLIQTGRVLKRGGRLVVISYHSLEDRAVKNYMSKGNFSGDTEKDFYGNLIRPFTPITKKPMIPSEREVERNPRARSAKLRIAQKN